MSKVLLFGPFSPPVTGQSMAFRKVVDNISEEQAVLIDTTKYNSALLSAMNAVILAMFKLLFDARIKTIYFTCSRTVLGSLRELPLLWIGGLRKKKIINHLHGADFAMFYNQSNGVFKFLIRWAYKNVHTSIVLTEAMSKEFEMFPSMKTTVVSNFYPAQLDEYQEVQGPPLVITYFSNLMKSKGILEFIKAAGIVSKSYPGTKFLIAGMFLGDHLANRQEIEQQVSQLLSGNINNSIEYIGGINPGDRLAFLSKSGIFVLPTYYPTEGVPLTILEAMRCGNAIVSTKHNYLPDILNESNGILVEPSDVGQLAAGLKMLISDPQKLKTIQAYNMNQAIKEYSEVVYLADIKKLIFAS